MTEPNASPRRWPKVLAGVLLLLALVLVAAAFTLDRLLTSAARDQAALLSGRWQRPVEIGAVTTTFLTGLGVRVDGVRIGAAPGEPRPLLELDRAEVKLELLRALRSGGRDVRVRSAELKGLRVTVMRLKDGTTNVQRLADAMAGEAPAGAPGAVPKPGAEEKPADLSMVRVEHAAVLGARIGFVDEATGGPELSVERIDLVVSGLAAGAPLEVTLTAGLLSAEQNLELKIHAPPLPSTLVPAPDRLTLRMAPVDLTPLAAFAPRGAGFLGGRLQADLEVALGAAVPGGGGPTTVRGGFAATALRFSGQEGGKALDVTLDVDLAADAAKGDLSIGRLRFAFGPAVLEGQGKVSGLLSDHPSVEGLRVVARDLDLASLAPYYPPLPRLLGGTAAGPIGLILEAAGSAARPVIELRADLTPVRLSFAKRVEKAAGGRLALTVRLRGGAGGALGFDAEGDLSGLDLRPGGTLAKKPGDRFTVKVAGTRRATGPAQALEISSLSVALVDMGLEAHGTVETAPRSTRFDLAAAIDRLDADRLLLPSPPSTGPAQPAAAAGKGAASPFAGLSGRATLRVGEAVVRRQRVTDLRATVEVKGDEVTLSEGRFGAWGGTVSLAGTQVRLAPTEPPFTVVARAEGVQAAAALAAWTDRQVLSGQLDTAVRLSGQGATSEAIQRALDGTVEGTLKDGVFHGKDLVAEVAAPLVAAIPGLKGKVSRGGTTSLGKAVPFSVRIQGGQARLQKPLEVENRDATATVQGSVALDGELDMPVRLSLAPRTVSELTGGRARLQVPLPLDFTLRGKAWSPRLAGLEVGPAVRAITEAIGAQALGKVLGLGGQAPAGAEGAGQGAAETGAQDAKAKADAARRKLEEDASKALKKLLGR